MSINESNQMASRPGVRPEGHSLLRTTSTIAVVAGAGGSVGLTLYAGRHSDSLTLKVLFAVWVLSPFLGLILAGVATRLWSIFTRSARYSAMLVVSLGSLAVYGVRVLRPPKAHAAFVFVVVPLASWLLIAVVVPLASWLSGRESRRKDGV
jgi:hypothetical protein